MGIRPTTKKASDVITAVQRQFGDEAGIQVTDSDIFRWINDAQREILVVNKTYKATAVTDLVAGTYEYTFPDEPIVDIQSIWINGTRIKYQSFPEFEEYSVANDPNRNNTGTPYVWTEWAGQFIFYPTPDTDSAGGIKIHYTRGATEVSSAADPLSVPDLYFNRVVEYCMAQAYELDEDYQASQMKLGQFTDGISSQNDTTIHESPFYPSITVLDEDW